MGLNGMGKSSVIQSLLLLRQSYINGFNFRNEIILNGEYTNIGNGKDALYQFAKNESIEFKLKFEHQVELNIICESEPDSNILTRKIDSNDWEDEKYDEKIIDLNIENLFSKNFQYLNAEHIGPQRTYLQNTHQVVRNLSLGIKGEFAAHYLDTFRNKKIEFQNLKHENCKFDELIKQVDAWLGEVTPGVKLNTRSIPQASSVLMDFQFQTKNDYTNEFSPLNVGFGLTYVLPAIVTLLTASEDKLMILENPESHLHPQGQNTIGRLMSLAAQNKVQIIAETHSDHIVNGVRVAVKKGELDPEKVNIFYFNRDMEDGEHRVTCSVLKIDKDGRIDDWPEGFIDQWEKNLTELL
jgi:predicted ATPase